jgi:transglutaminase-like putative cysteine protease
MPRLKVTHLTTYRYAYPVAFGEHRMMLRPRDSHDLRILGTGLAIQPAPSSVRWLHDVFGNSVAVARFETMAATLTIESEITLDLYAREAPDYPIEEFARLYPFGYAVDDLPDLARCIERHYPDPERVLEHWARGFILPEGETDTWDLLVRMTRAVQRDFGYAVREAAGIQAPASTLALRQGTCRDFALLLMEAVRALGFAARFVTGYLYQPAAGGHVGGGATHAWTQIYLPGAGWVEFDPTNGIVGNRDLIRVAVGRDPSQAIPLSGTYAGPKEAFLDMAVAVQVARVG